MRKNLFFLKFIVMAIILSAMSITNTVQGVPANPFPKKFIQPNGTEIEYVLAGDEFFNYTKTTDGNYVIKFDSETGYFCYAKQVDFLILSTDLRVGVDPPPDENDILTPDKLVRRDIYKRKNIRVCANDEEIIVNTADLIRIEDDALYLPLRIIFENLGFTVGWEDKSRTVILSISNTANPLHNNLDVSLQIDSDFIVLNGDNILVENRAKLFDSKTFLPLSIFSKILGKDNIITDIKQEEIVININSR